MELVLILVEFEEFDGTLLIALGFGTLLCSIRDFNKNRFPNLRFLQATCSLVSSYKFI